MPLLPAICPTTTCGGADYAKGVLTRVEPLLAARGGIPVLVDPKGDDYSRYRGATLVTPNRSEMQQAVGRWSSESELTGRAQQLRAELDLEALLVTRSEQGMTLFTDAGRDHIDAQAHEGVRRVRRGRHRAGDAGRHARRGLALGRGMAWANKAGGIAVGKLGTSVVTAAELAGETA